MASNLNADGSFFFIIVCLGTFDFDIILVLLF